ncbi:hypothetical protein BJ508DRAFT_93267 [Ascobolus immersus RN42]|uniref:MYND-type domain-containing protein n=1 Tax=Ascobolus immersus RN42 TaxID=1160509 RepID=A0A3N4IDB6_ASCIM|nr:hypothetical protein BJ508DRAFT_93267 [Ascobolus immersus RN42]
MAELDRLFIPPITRVHIEACLECKKMVPTKKCSGCKKTWYCSRECQKKAWPEHRQECLDFAKYKAAGVDEEPKPSASSSSTPSREGRPVTTDLITGRPIFFQGEQFTYRKPADDDLHPVHYFGIIGNPYVKAESECFRTICRMNEADVKTLAIRGSDPALVHKRNTLIAEFSSTMSQMFVYRRSWNCIRCSKPTEHFEICGGVLDLDDSDAPEGSQWKVLPAFYQYIIPSCKTEVCIRKTKVLVNEKFAGSLVARKEMKSSHLMGSLKHWEWVEDRRISREVLAKAQGR